MAFGTRVRVPRLTLVVTLLVTTLGVASALAWQAHQAARSHRQAAERVVHDYAEVAGWEFSRAARRDLDAALDRWLQTIACAPATGTLPSPAGPGSRNACNGEDVPARTLFRADARPAELTTTGEPPGPEARAWIRHAAEDGSSGRGMPHPARRLKIDVVDGQLRVLAGRSVHAANGGGAAAFAGFVADPSAIGRIIARAVGRTPLLPP